MEQIEQELYHSDLKLLEENFDGYNNSFRASISQLTKYNDGQHIFQVFSLFENKPNEKFCFYIQTKCEDYTLNSDNDNKAIISCLALRPTRLSFDSNSENFVRYISKLFNVEPKESFVMSDMVEFDFVYLENKILTLSEMLTKRIELKLICNQYYCEWYLNLDLPNRVVEFIEKDEEYRENIIKLMTKK